MLRVFLGLVLILSLFSCIDPFKVDIYDRNSGGQLVVEGIITSEDKAHIVRLSRSAPVSEFQGYQQVSGASVSIEDDLSNCYQLLESQAGVYVTNPLEFVSAYGRAYQLKITLDTGVEYISDFQKLESVEPIDRLWVRGERESFLAGSSVIESERLNVYTNIDVAEEVKYLSYEYEGVYELKSFLQGSTDCWDSVELIPSEIIPLDTGRSCFKEQVISLPLNIYSTENLMLGENINQNIFSIAPSRIFYFGYSMLVKKYALTKGYYNYLDQIKEQSNYGEGLFTPPPTPVVGNIHEVDNESNRALGFFTSINSTTKRVFINEFVLEDPIRDPLNRLSCMNSFPIDDPPPPPEFCCDCLLLEGATDQKPDFWPL